MHAHGHRGDIDFQIAYADDLLGGRFGLRAQDVADSGDQLTRTEGLGDVAIAAEVEGLQAVGFLGAGGQENDGRFAQALVLANLAAEIESADAGQHDIEQEERGLHHGGLGNYGGSGEKGGDFVSGGAQVVFDEARHIGIVFDHVDQIRVERVVCRLHSTHVRKRASRALEEL